MDGITDSMEMGLSRLPTVGDGQGGLACSVHGVTKSRTRLNNGTELNLQLCRKNIREHLHDLGFVPSSLNMIPKIQKTMKNRYTGFQKN